MFPLLPFAAGLVTGAVLTRLVKPEKTRATLDRAQERVREATVSSLAAIEHTSAGLRARLMHATDEAPGPEESDEQPQSEGAGRSEPKSTLASAGTSGEEGQPRKAPRRRTTAKPAESDDRADKPDEDAV